MGDHLQDWRNLFVSREDELAQLHVLWKQACGGETLVAALVAESGFGKTRLAQEFYNLLATVYDAKGDASYWPSRLGAEGRNLHYNPVLPETAPLSGLPYLWWGMRLENRSDRNRQFGTELSNGQRVLQSHLLRYEIARRRGEIEATKQREQKRIALDLGLDLLGSLTTFGLLGIVKDLTEFGDTVRRLDTEALSLGSGQISESEDVTDLIIADIDRVCRNPPDGIAPVPVCILFDDVQFIEQDPSVDDLFKRLIVEGQTRKWPLMILVTSWEREWHGIAGSGLKDRIRALGIAPQEIAVRKLDLGPVLDTALLGLPADQKQQILEKADGNPRFLDIIIGHLRENPKFFVANDIQGPLNADGEAVLAKTSQQEFVLRRLRDSPVEMQQLLSLASLQGIGFSPGIAVETFQKLRGYVDKMLVAQAENPYAFIFTKASQAEFSHHSVWQTANGELSNHFETSKASDAFSAALSMKPAEADETESADEIIAQQIDSEVEQERTAAIAAVERIFARAILERRSRVARTAALAWLSAQEKMVQPNIRSTNLHSMSTVLRLTPDHDRLLALVRRWLADIVGADPADFNHSQADGADIDFLFACSEFLASSRVNLDLSERKRMTQMSVDTIEESIRRFEAIPVRVPPEFWRKLRIALQRKSDFESDENAQAELLARQIELLDKYQTSSGFMNASDKANTYFRAANVHAALGDRETATRQVDMGMQLWHDLLAKDRSTNVLDRVAKAHIQKNGVLALLSSSDAERLENNRSGIALALQLYFLEPENQEALDSIFAFANALGRDAHGIPEFALFLQRGHDEIEAALPKLRQGDLGQQGVRRISKLSAFLAQISEVTGNRQQEIAFRNIVVESLGALDNLPTDTQLLNELSFEHVKLFRYYLFRIRWRSAARHFARLSKIQTQIIEIYESQGIDRTFGDIRNARVQRMTTPGGSSSPDNEE